jgi:hypothetical protein
MIMIERNPRFSGRQSASPHDLPGTLRFITMHHPAGNSDAGVGLLFAGDWTAIFERPKRKDWLQPNTQ